MERILATNSTLEPLAAAEAVREKIAVETVRKEMSEADEANLLEEEDMHVFDREPLLDRLPLVSCNTCKKPIKASQYAMHAERCRSIIVVDDNLIDVDGGSSYKKPPRKTRKKTSPHESFVDAGRATMESATLMGVEKSQQSDFEGPTLSSQSGKNAGFLLQANCNTKTLDAHVGKGFQQNLQFGSGVQPLAMKIYRLTNHQRLRSVLGSLYYENSEKSYPVTSCIGSMPIQSGGTPAPNSVLETAPANVSHQRPSHVLGIKKMQ